jgi:signal transduction histidine kinase
VEVENLGKGFEVIEPRTKTHYFLQSFSVMDQHFVVSKNLTTVYHGLRELTYILIAVVPVMIILMNCFIIYVINNTLRPIRTTIKTAQMITTQNLSRRIQEPVSEDEIGQLVHTLNQMIDRLEKGYQRIYNFTGNVAHELRTPLTIIAGELELAIKKEKNPEIKGWMQDIYEETQFLKKMINRLLLLTRLENQLIEPEFYEINLTHIVRRCIHRYNAFAQEKKLHLQLNGECHSTIFGDETLLEELMDILIENAIKYSESGGTIDIDFICDDSQCKILIRDNCKDKISYWHDNLFTRFRGSEHFSGRKNIGLGIGLSIAKEIVDFHHGSIACTESPPRGCIFIVSLPLAIYEEDDHP